MAGQQTPPVSPLATGNEVVQPRQHWPAVANGADTAETHERAKLAAGKVRPGKE
jgi:hypothetical protein